MKLLQDYIDAIAFGVTELHREATRDAYVEGFEAGRRSEGRDAYGQGYADAIEDLDTDQGDEEPFLSEEFVHTDNCHCQTCEAYYDPFTRDVDYSEFMNSLPALPEHPDWEGKDVILPGDEVRVKAGVNIIDSQLVEGRYGFVIEVAGEEHTAHRASGQTVLVGFPGTAIERPDKTYTQTWWLSPEALEVIA